MTLLSLASEIVRAVRHRRAVESLIALDDHTLADIGLLRTDVHASLAVPFFKDPSGALNQACCHWRTFARRLVGPAKPLPCC